MPACCITGPFSIILGFTGGLMALNDRLKLRSHGRVAKRATGSIIASEEAAIRVDGAARGTCLDAPMGGEPVIVRVEGRCLLMTVSYLFSGV